MTQEEYQSLKVGDKVILLYFNLRLVSTVEFIGEETCNVKIDKPLYFERMVRSGLVLFLEPTTYITRATADRHYLELIKESEL